MGQYFIIVNPAKRQYLNPVRFGHGLKLQEFFSEQDGPAAALVALLAHGNGMGAGDLETGSLSPEEAAMIGSWAGDPVVVAGDYGDHWFRVPEDIRARLGEDKPATLYQVARRFFDDISDKIIAAVAKATGGSHPWAAITTDMGKDLTDDEVKRAAADGSVAGLSSLFGLFGPSTRR